MAERVINIIGLGKSGKTVPDTGENWGINYAYKHGCKLDKLFCFDNLFDGQDKLIPPTDYNIEQYLAEKPNIEIVGRFGAEVRNEKAETIAKIKEYQLQAALDLIPGAYFTSTIAYMIAQCIVEKVDRIRLYGFELWSGSDANEYVVQRPCVDFWLAFAIGRGIKVEVPWYLMQTCNNQQNYYGYFEGELNKILKKRV